MLSGTWTVAALIADVILKLVFIGVVLLRQRFSPASTLAWLVIVLAFPAAIGFIAYLLVGEVRLGRRRIQHHREIVRLIESSIMPTTAMQRTIRPTIPLQYQPIAALGEAVGNHPVLGGNALELISDADLYIQRLVEDIDRATLHCHLLYYIYLDDHSGRRIAEALMRAAARGVKCRVLVDAVGSRRFLHSKLRQTMEQTDVRVVAALAANPLRMVFARVDLRNHRKIAVVDGVIAYTGSQNIADAEFAPKARYAPWVDTSVRVEGPVVHDLQMLFVEDWYLDTNESLVDLLAIETPIFEDGMAAQVLGSGPNSYNEAMHQLSQSAFHTARHELILTTPYYVPDDATSAALCTAARRGVDTSLVVPARNDSRLVRIASCSYYDSLLEAGVKLYEFQDGLLHAKTMTMDRDLSIITTANLDRRSFELNFEVSVVVFDSDFSSQLRFLQRSYISRSVRIDHHRWRNRSRATRLGQNAIGILSPLL